MSLIFLYVVGFKKTININRANHILSIKNLGLFKNSNESINIQNVTEVLLVRTVTKGTRKNFLRKSIYLMSANGSNVPILSTTANFLTLSWHEDKADKVVAALSEFLKIPFRAENK